MNICYCYGPNWAKYVPIELYSLFKHNKVNHVYLMSEKATEEHLAICRELCEENGVELTYVDMLPFAQTHITTRKNVDTRFTKYTLFRLGIPDFVKEDRVLYLDSDTLVLGDISEFYNTDLGDAVIAGSIDTGITQKHIKSIGGDVNSHYLNAGVLLMDLKKLREMKIVKTWLSMIDKQHYPAHDQDIIFLTLAGKFKVVDPIYNCSLSTSYSMPDEDVKILHLAGDKSRSWTAGIPKSHLWLEVEKEYLKSTRKPEEYKQRINKIIAYGWFGKGPKPEKIQQCIASWKKFCPDWEIIELNEDNCDITENAFVKAAFEAKKYAFVADYFRMKAMYDWGCVTLDADVELIKPIDEFLHHRMFSGQEIDGRVLITATMGAEKGHPVVKKLMDYYRVAKFHPGYNTPNTTWITEIFKKIVSHKEGEKLILIDDVHLYPKYYFCNYDHKKLQMIPDVRSYAIHWFRGSWK